MQKGKQSLQFETAPHILAWGAVVGKKEGEGPLGHLFDEVEQDPMFGMNSWEEAESELQKRTAHLIIEKSGIPMGKIRYLFAGDLLGQIIATSYGLSSLGIPIFGLYGACSTMGEAMSLGALAVSSGQADHVLCMTSSHFASAEKEFRFPLEYGNQRPFSATWTVTGAGGVILGRSGGTVKISGITTGKIIDYGIKDSMNMGAAMAPAAADTIFRNFLDFGVDEEYYDKIITGDLGVVGKQALLDLLKEKGFDITEKHMDCGMEIYDSSEQDTHSGGSGCGCSATVLCSYLLKELEEKNWRKILFVPTGALLSPTSFKEGQSIPGIAHGVVIERC